MSWLYLVFAIFFEIVGTVLMKLSHKAIAIFLIIVGAVLFNISEQSNDKQQQIQEVTHLKTQQKWEVQYGNDSKKAVYARIKMVFPCYRFFFYIVF